MIRRRRSLRAAALVLAAGVLVACDPRPFPPPAVESFVHSRDVPPLGFGVDDLDETTVTLTSADGLHHVLAVKVAHRPAELQLRLRGIARVPRGTGLLSLLDEDTDAGVSPDGLDASLDHAFIDADGEIVAVLRVRPCVPEEPCVVVDPDVTYRAILQTPSGWLADQGIERGATVEIGPIEPATEA